MPVSYAVNIIIQILFKKSNNINISLNIAYDNITIYKTTLLLLFTLISLCAKGFLFIYLGFVPILLIPGVSSKIINILPRVDLIPVKPMLNVGILGFSCDPNNIPPQLASIRKDANKSYGILKNHFSEFYLYSSSGFAEVYLDENGFLESVTYIHQNDGQRRRIYKVLSIQNSKDLKYHYPVNQSFHKLHNHLNYDPVSNILDKLENNRNNLGSPLSS